MTMMSPVFCLLGQHEPNRNKVRWDGLAYHGKCKHCGAKIEHISRRNWREQAV